jgi:uncharacterized protein (TIGR03435 family)
MLTRHAVCRFVPAAVVAIGLPLATTALRAAPPQVLTATAPSVQAPEVKPPDPSVPLFFEVASVKVNNSGERNQFIRRQPGGRMTATNMPLRALIAFAYQATPLTLVGGPSWANDEHYDIVAKIEGDPPPIPPNVGPDHMQLALRTLLADRFQLKVHRETREMDAYALVMAKPGGTPGPGLKQSTQDCSPAAIRAMTAGRSGGPGGPPPGPPPPGSPVMCGLMMGPGRMRMGGMAVSMMAGPLGGMTGRSVVDRTGLTGAWDFELTFAPDPGRGAPPPDAPAADSNAPSLFTALQEQLGLKLDSTRAPIDVVVIDSVEHAVPD